MKDITNPYIGSLSEAALSLSSVQQTAEKRIADFVAQQASAIDKYRPLLQDFNQWRVPAIVEASRALENIMPFQATQILQMQKALENAVLKISEPILEIQRRMEEAAKAYSSHIQRIIEASQQLANGIEQFRNPLINLAETFARMENAALIHISRLPDNFEALWQRYYEIEKRAFTLFARLGLTGLESSLTPFDCSNVLEIQAKEGDDAALSYIFGIFKDDDYLQLDRLVSGWMDTEYIADRQKAVRSAIEAHKREEYELTISTLLPMIDGLSAQILAPIPNVNRKTIRVGEAVRMYGQIEPEFSEYLIQVVENILFSDVNLRQIQTVPSPNNRHAILHGRVANFGTELCSYQVILLLGAMVNISQRVPQLVT